VSLNNQKDIRVGSGVDGHGDPSIIAPGGKASGGITALTAKV